MDSPSWLRVLFIKYKGFPKNSLGRILLDFLRLSGGQMKSLIESTNPTSRRSSPANQGQNERGQSLVELAISLTIILLLLAGAVDFSIAYFSFSAMQDAAQEGALYGSINPTDEAGIITRVRSASTTPVDLSNEDLVDVKVTLPAEMPVKGTRSGSM